MLVTGNNMIAIQVGLDGFTMNRGCARSEWLGAGLVFNTSELHQRYEKVSISLFTEKFTIVPEAFFSEDSAREMLSDTVKLSDSDVVEYRALPEFGAYAIYSMSSASTLARLLHDMVLQTDGSKGEYYPELYFLLKSLQEISDYNKIAASYADGRLYLVVAQGKTLLLCNSFSAPDFVTAQYYIFNVMKNFQLNPEVSSIWFRTPLAPEDEASLYNYFKSVDSLY